MAKKYQALTWNRIGRQALNEVNFMELKTKIELPKEVTDAIKEAVIQFLAPVDSTKAGL